MFRFFFGGGVYSKVKMPSVSSFIPRRQRYHSSYLTLGEEANQCSPQNFKQFLPHCECVKKNN